jgi:hypothetical protein
MTERSQICPYYHHLDGVSFVPAAAGLQVFDGQELKSQDEASVAGECNAPRALCFVTREQIRGCCFTAEHKQCSRFPLRLLKTLV